MRSAVEVTSSDPNNRELAEKARNLEVMKECECEDANSPRSFASIVLLMLNERGMMYCQ